MTNLQNDLAHTLPQDIIDAIAKVSDYFRERGAVKWVCGPLQSRDNTAHLEAQITSLQREVQFERNCTAAAQRKINSLNGTMRKVYDARGRSAPF